MHIYPRGDISRLKRRRKESEGSFRGPSSWGKVVKMRIDSAFVTYRSNVRVLRVPRIPCIYDTPLSSS